VRSLSRFALTLAALGVLVAIVRTCLRPAAHPESQAQQAICAPAVSPRVALVVVDALRADTFFGDAFASFRQAHPTAAAGVARTSPVSMSTAGVRSMATGTFPDLFDVLHNWDNVKSGVPAVPALARAAGQKTAIFGDSIWRELFPDDFVIAETEAHIPRIIYYLRAETLIDDTFVGRLAERLQKESPPDFLVLHLVGLDHAGHRHGVKSAKYADVARRVAAHVERVVGLLPAGTTVLLTSDHGATDSGGHGGGSEAETTAPLFAFGAGVAPGARVNINQIDLAPTLSCLLGLPFPATSLGRPAVELFDEPEATHLARLRAGLSQVEHAWAGPTDAPASGGVRASGDATERRALDARFTALFEAFARNVARTRLPVALWGLVLLVFLIAQMGDLQMSRPRSAATAALMSAGIVLTGFSSNWSLLGLVLCLAVTLLFCAVAEARRARFATPAHLLWLVSAGAAVLLALARDYQGRSTTLLFGSPSDAKLALGGAALCVALRALDIRLRMFARDRSPYLMLPIIFMAVIEGGDPAIGIGNGFVAAWLAWDAVRGWRVRDDGRALRLIGALAQGALLALFLSPPWFKGWIHADARSTPAGSVAALVALWFMRPRATSRQRWLPFVGLPAFVFAVDRLRSAGLGETAVEIGLAAALASLVVFATIAWRRADAPAAKWGMVCALLTLWWLLCAPPQRIVLGLAAVGLIAFVRSIRPTGPLAVTPALVGLALAFWRWGLIAHFEGEFGFGALEISLAYVGNPGRHAPQAALTILLKAWMPLAVAAALFANEKQGRFARAVSQATAFALGARIVHLAVATAFNPGSFYTIHRILGELTHEVVLLLGIGLFSFVRAPDRAAVPDETIELPAAARTMAE
jgi:hypothetical protein